MGLFGRKKDKKAEVSAEAVKAPETAKSETVKAPSVRTVKVPETDKKTETKSHFFAVPTAETAKKEPVKKAEPKKAPVVKPAVKPAVAKAPAVKPVVAKAPAVKAVAPKAAAPKTVRKAGVSAVVGAQRSPFVMTEDEVRVAFDQAIAEAEAEILSSNSKAVGKYEFELEVDGYHFYLIANNGQVLFDSPSFTTLVGALNGIRTFKKAVSGGNFEIKRDKYSRFRFILDRKYYGENYDSKDRCQSAAESVKKFARCAKIVRYTPDAEAIGQFEAARSAKRTPDDIDWRAVEQAEATAQKMGKFEIFCEDSGHYCFYLTANNGQILYASRYFTNEAGCRRGIESFKRAAYVGNFFVDRDKFGNFRYVLKNIGSAPNFIGESYDNKQQCERIIDSVKKFIVSATIEKSES